MPLGMGMNWGGQLPPGGLRIQDTSTKQKVEGNTSVSDEGLEMIADYCRKTMATVGGDGHTEYVLYRRAKDEYEVHSYVYYEYMEEEAHKAYQASKEVANLVMQYVDDNKLIDYQNRKGMPICGGMEVIKFIKEGKVYRITSENLNPDEYGIIVGLRNILLACMTQENELN